MATPQELLRRVAAFARDLLPAQLTQLIFPAATFALTAAAFSPWIGFAFWDPFAWEDRPSQGIQDAILALGRIGWPLQHLVLVSAMFCLYASFGTPKSWKSVMCRWVLVPTLIALVVFLGTALFFAPNLQASVMLSRGTIHEAFSKLLALEPYFGTGLYWCIGGWLLAVTGTVLAGRGRVALPLGFSMAGDEPTEAGALQARIVRFSIFVIVGPILARILVNLIEILTWKFGGYTLPEYEWIALSHLVAASAIPTLGALWYFGENRRTEWKEILRPGPWKIWLWAAALPLLIGAGPWLILPLLKDLVWHLPSVREQVPSSLEGYFELPSLAILGFLPATFLEEIGWRGFLQPRMVSLFGLRRGIFLVGLIWAAFHFSGDSSAAPQLGMEWSLFSRLLSIGIYAVAFGWLFLKSGSIWPVTIAHALLNFSKSPELFSRFGPLVERMGHTQLILWAIAGYLLFRRFPPQLSSKERPEESNA